MKVFDLIGVAVIALALLCFGMPAAFAAESTINVLSSTPVLDATSATAGAVVMTLAILGITPMLIGYEAAFMIPDEGGGDAYGGEQPDDGESTNEDDDNVDPPADPAGETESEDPPIDLPVDAV